MTRQRAPGAANKELFGVFGDRREFRRFRSPGEFDRVVEGPSVTVGIRDVGLGVPNRSTTYSTRNGACALWGEVFAPDDAAAGPAEWLLSAYARRGPDALSELNGSFLAVVDDGDEPLVATDIVRSWQCYYTDAPGVRVFGTDPTAVARTIETPTLATTPLLEFFHVGVVTGDRTVIEQLRRVPFDGAIGPYAGRTLDRFVYEPREFDYVGELADRMERALRRRADYPGRKGVLLSGGYDSRLMASQIPDVDECYTVGTPGRGEAGVAAKVARQYGATHRTLPVDQRYLNVEKPVVKYGQGVYESLHIHHGGYNAEMPVDTMYHGLLFDTVLRGYFLPQDGVDLFGYTFPRNRLDPDPDLIGAVSKRFGVMPESEQIFPDCDHVEANTSTEFVTGVVASALEEFGDRYDSIHNGIALFGVQNQPTMSFRAHLADNYLESFVAIDRELVEWHLATPPEHRSTETFLEAIRRVDPDVLRHRPPDRPHDSDRLNEIEGFVRRTVPGLEPFDTPWPDRSALYDDADLDRRLFADYSSIHDLPVRLKLRINDLTNWLELATGSEEVTPVDVLCPPFGTGQPVHNLAD